MIPSDCGENITSTSWTSRVGALTPRSEGVRCLIRLRLDDEMDASFVAPDEPCEELVRPSRLVVVVGVHAPDLLDEDADVSEADADATQPSASSSTPSNGQPKTWEEVCALLYSSTTKS